MTRADAEHRLIVEVCGAADRAAALQFVYSRLEPAQRERQVAHVLGLAAAGATTLEGLFVARTPDKLRGAILVDLQPGRVALLYPPGTSGKPLQAEVSAELLQAAIDFCTSRHVRIVQALLETDTGATADALGAAGLSHTVDLLYLVSTHESFPDVQPQSSLSFAPCQPDQQERLGALIERTYVASLDCPALDTARDIEDVLDGYRHTGVFAAERWLFVRQEGRDVGCLLLADYPEHDQWELVYMGLVPEVRGRTLGVDVTRYAQWLTRCAGRNRLVLAVDASNVPALAMYAACGFIAWDRRSVYVRLLEP
jgi:RimJ/RimL family protein N-acetyltransferase